MYPPAICHTQLQLCTHSRMVDEEIHMLDSVLLCMYMAAVLT